MQLDNFVSVSDPGPRAVYGLGFGVQFMVEGLGFSVRGVGSRVEG